MSGFCQPGLSFAHLLFAGWKAAAGWRRQHLSLGGVAGTSRTGQGDAFLMGQLYKSGCVHGTWVLMLPLTRSDLVKRLQLPLCLTFFNQLLSPPVLFSSGFILPQHTLFPLPPSLALHCQLAEWLAQAGQPDAARQQAPLPALGTFCCSLKFTKEQTLAYSSVTQLNWCKSEM